jgi:hypothetical protein
MGGDRQQIACLISGSYEYQKENEIRAKGQKTARALCSGVVMEGLFEKHCIKKPGEPKSNKAFWKQETLTLI